MFGDDPHRTVLVEITRVPSPDGKRDAVLIKDDGSSSSAYLTIVKPMGDIYSKSRVATLMHCDNRESLELEWRSPTELDVIGHCDDVIYGDVLLEEHDRIRLLIPLTVWG